VYLPVQTPTGFEVPEGLLWVGSRPSKWHREALDQWLSRKQSFTENARTLPKYGFGQHVSDNLRCDLDEEHFPGDDDTFVTIRSRRQFAAKLIW
jgi:hypothetical protein